MILALLVLKSKKHKSILKEKKMMNFFEWEILADIECATFLPELIMNCGSKRKMLAKKL